MSNSYDKDDFCFFEKVHDSSDEKLKNYEGQQYAYLSYQDPVTVVYFNYDEHSSFLSQKKIINNKEKDGANREEVHHISYAHQIAFDNRNKSEDIRKIAGFDGFPFTCIIKAKDTIFQDGEDAKFNNIKRLIDKAIAYGTDK